MSDPEIRLVLQGGTFAATERMRLIITKLFELGFFNIRRGKAIVHFDHNGDMGSVDIELKRWERKDESRNQQAQMPVDKLYENVTITVKDPKPSTKGG